MIINYFLAITMNKDRINKSRICPTSILGKIQQATGLYRRSRNYSGPLVMFIQKAGVRANGAVWVCVEDSLPEMFKGMHCSHQFCPSCMTWYILSWLQ
ncbi:hypothetical protein SUGI_0945350 [Cryptomeria japonica]|nr:hypothetical protein SUGI_0945350 [Cryptomeria japonica]